ncbi:MAG: RtcB family protein, partial [Methanomicrobium sp.]|nr:RtcB family protein [Methanomicrobium sp.]
MIDKINKISDVEWELKEGFMPNMSVPARIYISELLAQTLEEGAATQLANVATLPGILKYSLAMPDVHWGYGFPIGGVAGFDADTGIISPGGVGFDINCGVRLITTPVKASSNEMPKIKRLITELFHTVPTGVGTHAEKKLNEKELDDIMNEGAGWMVNNGYGNPHDLIRCEDNGCMKGADTAFV